MIGDGTVYTYFEDFRSEEEGATGATTVPILELWEASWRSHGWKTVILGRADAQQHPRYEEFLATVAGYPTVNDKRYETACYLRWLAVDVVRGTLMTDSDVLNFGLSPSDSRISRLLAWSEDRPIVLDRGRVPCAVLMPSSNARASIIDTLVDDAVVLNSVVQVNDCDHVSDMTVFQASKLGRLAALCDLQSADLPLRHFASVSSGGPAGKVDLMRAELATANSRVSEDVDGQGRNVEFSPSEWRIRLLARLVEVKGELAPVGYEARCATADSSELNEQVDLLRVIREQSDGAVSEAWARFGQFMIEEGLLDGLDVDGLVLLLMGRRPGPDERWLNESTLEGTLTSILRSAEWQMRLPGLARSAVARGRWTYFAHVPKSGGSALEVAFASVYGLGSVYRTPGPNDQKPGSHPWIVAQFAERLLYNNNPHVMVSGHTPIHILTHGDSASPTDQVVSVVRNPLEQIVSLVNFYLDRVESYPEEASSFWGAFEHSVPEGGVPSLDLGLVAERMSVHMSNLRASTYLQRPGLGLLESIRADRVKIGVTERLSEAMDAVAPGSVGNLALLGQLTTINESSHDLTLDAFTAVEVGSLVRSWAPLFQDYAEVLAAVALGSSLGPTV